MPAFWPCAGAVRNESPSDYHTEVPSDAPHYLLRPEAAESIYYMWFAHRLPDSFHNSAAPPSGPGSFEAVGRISFMDPFLALSQE